MLERKEKKISAVERRGLKVLKPTKYITDHSISFKNTCQLNYSENIVFT